MVHRSRSVLRPRVTIDGRRLVSHAGVGLLSELADRSGLTLGLSEAMGRCGIRWHTHDPGVGHLPVWRRGFMTLAGRFLPIWLVLCSRGWSAASWCCTS